MRLVHLSDLHLGYRQYQRLTPGGVNQREADVAATFRAVIDRVIEIKPDVVVVAGDVFHSVRPTNQAILHAFLQFGRLVRSVPDALVIIVAGNHDTPRSTESGGILPLLGQLGIHIVDRDAKLLDFPERNLSILAVPDVPGLVRPTLKPQGSARYNVLVLHGKIHGAIPEYISAIEPSSIELSAAELNASRWDYIALGHYHVYSEVKENAYYSGSIDYTSLNVWGDLSEEEDNGVPTKGFIERDLERRTHRFHPVKPVRELVDLRPIDARGLTAVEVDDRIAAVVDACKGGIDDKIVRLVVHDVSRPIARELNHARIREYKRRALNFNLSLRAPDRRPGVSGAPSGRRQLDLREVVREKLTARPLDADINREEFVARALAYIEQAQNAELATIAGTGAGAG